MKIELIELNLLNSGVQFGVSEFVSECWGRESSPGVPRIPVRFGQIGGTPFSSIFGGIRISSILWVSMDSVDSMDSMDSMDFYGFHRFIENENEVED